MFSAGSQDTSSKDVFGNPYNAGDCNTTRACLSNRHLEVNFGLNLCNLHILTNISYSNYKYCSFLPGPGQKKIIGTLRKHWQKNGNDFTSRVRKQ